MERERLITHMEKQQNKFILKQSFRGRGHWVVGWCSDNMKEICQVTVCVRSAPDKLIRVTLKLSPLTLRQHSSLHPCRCSVSSLDRSLWSDVGSQSLSHYIMRLQTGPCPCRRASPYAFKKFRRPMYLMKPLWSEKL
jgi:hypothetical protein